MLASSRRNVLLGLGAVAGLAACGGAGTAAEGRKLGVAVVGLGGVTGRNVLPSIEASDHCRVAGLVSSDAGKLQSLGKKFGVPASGRYTYENFDAIADNADVDIVYIALPNALHAEYTIRAARAGKHVICEKPMAVTVAECEAMIAACDEAQRSLAVAYRLHFSPHHQELLRVAREQELGPIQVIRADIGYPLGDEGGWRLDPALAGGGVLLEQGVYPVNTARSIMGEDPVEVLGYETKSDAKKFAGVEETVRWSMHFANGAVAHCNASYTIPANRIWMGGPSGWFQLERAYSADKIAASNSHGKVRLKQVDQFGLQMDHFARLIRNGEVPGAGISGKDGLRDVRIMTAIYESIRTKKAVQL